MTSSYVSERLAEAARALDEIDRLLRLAPSQGGEATRMHAVIYRLMDAIRSLSEAIEEAARHRYDR
nr:MAG: hypothetical protein DIU70_04545 [Bacillota bacterium]